MVVAVWGTMVKLLRVRGKRRSGMVYSRVGKKKKGTGEKVQKDKTKVTILREGGLRYQKWGRLGDDGVILDYLLDLGSMQRRRNEKEKKGRTHQLERG